jgi:hypothetical protein
MSSPSHNSSIGDGSTNSCDDDDDIFNWDGEDEEEGHGSDDGDDDETADEDHTISPDADTSPETLLLPLPSMLNQDELQDNDGLALINQEIELRVAQAVECLQHLQLSLGTKSAMFRKNRRLEKSQKNQTRAQKSRKNVDANIRAHTRQYNMTRQALLWLNAPDTVMKQFQELKKKDLTISKDVVEENRVGQRSEHVSWVWRFNMGHEGLEDDWMNESEPF